MGAGVAVRPLDGVTVLALEHAVAAPFATKQLADLGAQIIKIERPGSGYFARGYDDRVRGQSSYFIWLNRSKERLSLDVKRPKAKPVLEALVAKSDVLVQNLASGAAARLGLSFAALRPRHPRLVVRDISGYGDASPYRDRKGYDLLLQAESGMLAATGTPEHRARAGFSAADVAAGMYAYSSVIAALLLRERTGPGSRVDLSMLEAITEWMSNPLYYTYDGASSPVRSGAFHPSIVPYGPFKAGDGNLVILAVQNEREWAAFCERVLGDPGLENDPRFASNMLRTKNREALTCIVEARFSSLTAPRAIELLKYANIATARLNSVDDLWKHEQLSARERWRMIGSPGGEVRALLPPGTNQAFSPRMDAVPQLGQHTDAILLELGYQPGDIATLRDAKAVQPSATLASFAAGLRFEAIPPT
jgi:itaconate CoA-transferase